METEGGGKMKWCASFLQPLVYELHAAVFDRKSSIESWRLFSIFFTRSTEKEAFDVIYCSYNQIDRKIILSEVDRHLVLNTSWHERGQQTVVSTHVNKVCKVLAKDVLTFLSGICQTVIESFVFHSFFCCDKLSTTTKSCRLY